MDKIVNSETVEKKVVFSNGLCYNRTMTVSMREFMQ